MQILIAQAEGVLIYPLKLFCKHICNFLLFYFFRVIPQTTPEEKKIKELRSGERNGQIPLGPYVFCFLSIKESRCSIRI
jgi:hypothetical protein